VNQRGKVQIVLLTSRMVILRYYIS
jgi:hypothetical protein